jgi:hypothetical protein
MLEKWSENEDIAVEGSVQDLPADVELARSAPYPSAARW